MAEPPLCMKGLFEGRLPDWSASKMSAITTLCPNTALSNTALMGACKAEPGNHTMCFCCSMIHVVYALGAHLPSQCFGGFAGLLDELDKRPHLLFTLPCLLAIFI